MKKSFTVLTLCLMVVFPALAADAYLNVLGNSVNLNASSTVTGIAASKLNGGSISYNPSTKEVELKNVVVNNNTSDNYLIESDLNGLTVRVTGTCTVSMKGILMWTAGNVTLTGSSSGSSKLAFTRTGTAVSHPLIVSCSQSGGKNTFSIKNVTLNMTDNGYDVGLMEGRVATGGKMKLYLERAVIDLKAKSGATKPILSGFSEMECYQCGIRSDNGLFYNSGFAAGDPKNVQDADGNIATAELHIDEWATQVTAYPVKVMGRRVTSFNAGKVQDFGSNGYIDFDKNNAVVRLHDVKLTGIKPTGDVMIATTGTGTVAVETHGTNVITGYCDFIVANNDNGYIIVRGTGATSSSLAFTNQGQNGGKNSCVVMNGTGQSLYMEDGNFTFSSPKTPVQTINTQNSLYFMNCRASMNATVTYDYAIQGFYDVEFTDCSVTTPKNFVWVRTMHPMTEGTSLSNYYDVVIVEPKETTHENGTLIVNGVPMTNDNGAMGAVVPGVGYADGVLTLDNVDFTTAKNFIICNFDLLIKVQGMNKIKAQNFLLNISSSEHPANVTIQGVGSNATLETEATNAQLADYVFQSGGNLQISNLKLFKSTTPYVSFIGDYDKTVLGLRNSSGEFTTGQANRSAVMGITGLGLDNVELLDGVTFQPVDGTWDSPKGQPLRFKSTAIMKGDVDGNGKVNVSDVTTLVNMILGVIPKVMDRGDVDENGKINVSDVTALINIILGVS